MADVSLKRLRAYDLKGFHKIGRALGMSARMARYHANRAVDPLPVYRLDGGPHVVANVDELRAWNERRVQPYQPSAASVSPSVAA